MKIILATNNKNKLREIRKILEPLGISVLSQSDAGADIDVEETGVTFEENAFLKADAVYKLTGLPVIADDSGLEVDYLNNEPGVYSARYAEDSMKCRKILDKLEGVPAEKRTARFICVICYINSKGIPHIIKGSVGGSIGYEERGQGGFGYDPIFMYGDKSFAELSEDEKNAVSHRADALRKLTEILN